MNNIWHYLREFESKEIIKRFILNKYSYNISTEKAIEINSAFIQGREYFTSSQDADISVRPLLLYYGIVSLSRGLILLLDKNSREQNIKPSHGLKIINWQQICKTGQFEDIIVKSNNGTFTELINATKNICNFRANSSGVSWMVALPIPPISLTFRFKEVAFYFPDLNQSVNAWLETMIPYRKLNNYKQQADTQIIKISGKQDNELFTKIFPEKTFGKIEVNPIGNDCIIKIKSGKIPNFCQLWESAFQIIGDVCIIPPFENGNYFNTLSTMYMSSFILGTISRYYPSTWNNINKGITKDSIMPFTVNLMDLIHDKYPTCVLEYLKNLPDFNDQASE